VPSGEVADIQRDLCEARNLSGLSLREKTIRYPALVENLDRARLQTTGARSRELLVSAPLDDRDVDSRESQFSRQHQPGRAASRDHNLVL
jgi:hypothetical protein